MPLEWKLRKDAQNKISHCHWRKSVKQSEKNNKGERMMSMMTLSLAHLFKEETRFKAMLEAISLIVTGARSATMAQS